MSRNHHWLAPSALALAIAAGCSNQKPPPLYASSAEQHGYAARYPQMLEEHRGQVGEQEERIRRLLGGFDSYPDSLHDPDWGHVQRVVELSDQAGRSSTYAERYEESERISTFFSQEKDSIRQKVAGTVQWAAKGQGCEEPASLGGSAAHALESAVEKQRQRRLREHNEAHRHIDLNRAALGKKNAKALEQQADEISDASYTVYVGLERTRRQMAAMLEEASSVRSTLEASVQELDAQAANESVPKGDRESAKKRATASRVAIGQLQREQHQAEQVLKDMDRRLDQLRTEYSDALDRLRSRIEEKGKAAPAT